ncbi:helicase DnaB [Streptacidiphilus sp. PB12-B1b]|uniref:DnaB-like helicase N-terminal domain-containing protein n=1 Tax=Streptacidiphilus sp. PB12-B1b TaxID=2705012 RepID=UPI0015FB36D8|nr:DnaB-like helicase N-terminal domain-containing protein [Streptacidiphilus sp. PB12-B1b]QMU79029.1 helicase DnaB [Streptacidiphilus sp. PB12-B1b]
MTPLLRAEQALLGAVLLDPGQLALLDWLEPQHFYRPGHRAVFEALRTLHRVGHAGFAPDAGKAARLALLVDAQAEASYQVRGLSASYVHTLVAACPVSGNAVVYGRMVLEGAIHRTVTEHAVRLHQAARTDAAQGTAEHALVQADVLADVLHDLAERWNTGLPPAVANPALPGAAEVGCGEGVVADEEMLLRVLTCERGAMEQVVGWLRPDDFAVREHGEVYRCLGVLHHRGEPIDEVTLTWEARRRGLLAAAVTTSERLAQLGESPGGDPGWYGEAVLRACLARTAANAARTVQALAEDESLAPGRLLSQALAALEPLDQVRARWQQATGDAAPAEPAAADGPRARAALARSSRTAPPRTAPPHHARAAARSSAPLHRTDQHR